MALTIRLSKGLHFLASRMAGEHGISLNALISVSLAEYLQRHDRPVGREPVQEPVQQPVARPAVPVEGVVPSRQQRRRGELQARKRKGK